MSTNLLGRLVFAASFLTLQSHVEAAALCGGAPMVEGRTVSALPADLAVAIGAGPGQWIADAGQPFNSSDIPSSEAPQRRLIVAGVGKNCAAIVIEQGGIVHLVRLLRLRRYGGVWLLERANLLKDLPTSLPDVEALTAGDKPNSFAEADGLQAYSANDYVLARENWQLVWNATWNPSAENNLAYLLYYGLGGPADPELAIHHWAAAASSGHSAAQWHLGNAFQDGLALTRDDTMALAWYRCAIANADRSAADDPLRAIGNDARKSLAQLRRRLSARAARRGSRLAQECITGRFTELDLGIDRLDARRGSVKVVP